MNSNDHCTPVVRKELKKALDANNGERRKKADQFRKAFLLFVKRES